MSSETAWKAPGFAPHASGRRLIRRYWDALLPILAIWPPLILSAGHVVVFTLWTAWLSFTPSTLLPESGFVGWRNYVAVAGTRNFHVAYVNVVIFGIGFVILTSALGMLLAVLLDQRVRGENIFRTIFLYPMAVSFVVTGTIWSWLLNPGIGIQRLVQGWGWTGFRFDWLIDRDMAIYTVVIAGAWQAAGFAMALFLAGLRSVDAEIIKAAQIDGAGPWRIYRRVVLPTIGPIVLAVMVILLQMAIKTFDLVRALTGGGPGIATNMPTIVVYDFMFQRGQIGRGAAAAILMLLALVIVIVPYKSYQWWRERAR
ncbi:MAG: glucose/mannose transport system permease protein [Acetobacteraceae bacterium]|nr:glucose/mannose transport system permease protein [Acetobacteraceae bacterium]MEA2777680.1 glucose/mannose transport system permease protein [Acetobacteraceae bacterium]MEA2787668.1 glucose/mannose transport system permease protein [Acetobacteraceae bacterium]